MNSKYPLLAFTKLQIDMFYHKYFVLYMRGDQKVRGKKLPFLHRLINRAGITAHNTATHMQLIGFNLLDVSCLRALQRSSWQRYITQTGPIYVAF